MLNKFFLFYAIYLLTYTADENEITSINMSKVTLSVLLSDQLIECLV